MIDCRYLTDQTNAFYDKKRAEAAFLSEALEERLEENEEYLAIKYRLRKLKIDYQKALFIGENTDDLKKEIASTEKAFKKIRAGLSVENKTADPLSCPICSDKGRINGELCICYYKKLTGVAYDFLGVADKKKHVFSDDSLSEIAGSKSVFSAIKKFAAKVPGTDKNVLIIGRKGTGKTFLTECAVSEINEKKANALLLSAFNLDNVFIKNLSAPFADKIATNEILTTCDLLAVDDLGTEPIYNKVTIENLTAIISDRLDKGKPFLINTNLELNEIALRYGERLYSRLCGNKTVILKMDGKDLRFK